jgi:diacylglycerol kinase family enzyme
MAGLLLVNPRAGDAAPNAEELASAARSRGIAACVLREREDAAAVAREAEADVLGIAGGDGSLAQVAQVSLERSLPFVCIPYGTRNHFARDLGLDRHDPVAALDAFAGGESRIDVGWAGDRLFLNNVSLGLYAELVRRREHHRRRREALARIRASLLTLIRRGPLGITIDGEAVASQIVVVANNAYGFKPPVTIGARPPRRGDAAPLPGQRGASPRARSEAIRRGCRAEANRSRRGRRADRPRNADRVQDRGTRATGARARARRVELACSA